MVVVGARKSATKMWLFYAVLAPRYGHGVVDETATRRIEAWSARSLPTIVRVVVVADVPLEGRARGERRLTCRSEVPGAERKLLDSYLGSWV